jgi:hypothetical protein
MPEYISPAAELADAMEPNAAEAAQWAADYKRLGSPARYVLDDGEQVEPAKAKRDLADLNNALKRFMEANDLESGFHVEGVGTLALQRPQSEKVDLISLHQHDAETFFRLLQLGCLTVNADALKAQEKAGMIAADIPRMPIAQSPRLVWVSKDSGRRQ